ncbi:hypothetical protein CERSUDRAFT_95884 [Gelatoporia subvermispora B]|uniref:Uncharacterized protein n=1 Tax=Ceriporiopsis subvermispora (strain B) TaxID=914234 RepID=M2PK12_CERS8|nr:hypothetical protein CERSUDRAFT_95884 [Gelatoporia subvermispora B]
MAHWHRDNMYPNIASNSATFTFAPLPMASGGRSIGEALDQRWQHGGEYSSPVTHLLPFQQHGGIEQRLADNPRKHMVQRALNETQHSAAFTGMRPYLPHHPLTTRRDVNETQLHSDPLFEESVDIARHHNHLQPQHPQQVMPQYGGQYHVGTTKTKNTDSQNVIIMECNPSPSSPATEHQYSLHGRQGVMQSDSLAPQETTGYLSAYHPRMPIHYDPLEPNLPVEYASAMVHMPMQPPEYPAVPFSEVTRINIGKKQRSTRVNPRQKARPAGDKNAWGGRCLGCSKRNRKCERVKTEDQPPEPGARCRRCTANKICVYLAPFPNMEWKLVQPGWLVAPKFSVVPQTDLLDLPERVFTECLKGVSRHLRGVVHKHVTGSFVITWEDDD